MDQIFWKVVNVNENYLKLKAGYLFPEISKRVKNYTESNPNEDLITFDDLTIEEDM